MACAWSSTERLCALLWDCLAVGFLSDSATSDHFAGAVWLVAGGLLLVAALLLLIPEWSNGEGGLSVQSPLLNPLDEKLILPEEASSSPTSAEDAT